MNTRTLIAALMMSVAGSAFASEATLDNSSFVSTKTRAEVLAEVVQARDAGQLLVSEADYVRVPQFRIVKTRAAVIAETREALASGELKALNVEAQSYLPGTPVRATVAQPVLAMR
ncbi:MAG: DUF4148 domain-containing protein [Rubrivivax sp.]|nr:DUF4148 domain-containing protein [Rubrivivax sp.]